MPKGVYDRKPITDRIKEAVDICPTTDCWLWKQRVDKDGYGQVSLHQKTKHAHRVAYEAFVKPIESGMICSHICDAKYPTDSKEYRRCCNPEHIVIATPAENSARMKELGRTVAPAKWKPGDKVGDKNNNSKLTRDKVVEILTKFKNEGKLGQEVAIQYNVQYQTLYKITRGKLWKDVYEQFFPTV